MSNTRKLRRMARPLHDGADSAELLPDGAGSRPAATKRVTKASLLLDMLRQDGGTSLAAIVAATGWQAHTARAALTGVRKKGHTIERFSADGESRYRITEQSA